MRRIGKKAGAVIAAVLLGMGGMLGACGGNAESSASSTVSEIQEGSASSVSETASGSALAESGGESGSAADGSQAGQEKNAPEIAGLEYESAMELKYARGFDVYYYSGGYALIDIHDNARYLVVPEGAETPEGLDEDICVLLQPLDRMYLAATSAMALFDALDALDSIRLTGTAASGWYIDAAVEALNSGEMLFAGKYDEPDYELMIEEDCDLAIESTMILHAPKVQEMIEDLGIPVFIDRSSYEEHPLGRTEWIKLYSVLVDREEEAAAFFDQQAQVIEELKDFPNTGKTVAFFYVNTDGSIVVRASGDYIPEMIELGGGKYVFDDLTDEESNRSSISISMEDFYAAARDADYLIYNATIDNPIETTEELLAKNELFAEFKAVQEGNVWCAGKYLYQATDVIGQMTKDVNLMLTGGSEDEMTFLTKVSEEAS